MSMGVWEYESMGVWEYGSMGTDYRVSSIEYVSSIQYLISKYPVSSIE